MPSVQQRGFIANEDIVVSRFVEHDGTDDHHVNQAAGSNPIVGVSHEGGKFAPLSNLVTTDPPLAAEAGDPLTVYPPGYTALVEVGTGGVTAGDKVKSDANGAAIAVTETAGAQELVGGRAEQSGSDGDKVLVYIHPEALTTPV